VAALSYDNAALLANFAARKGITYSLLSDPESKVIRAFGILNTNFKPGQLPYGAPFPGMYIVDKHGIVRAKYFEEDHVERYTAASILVRHFGAPGAEETQIETPQVKLTSSASDAAVWPGNRITLSLDLEIKPGMHVYAPGVNGDYIPIDWTIAGSKNWLALPVIYPTSRMLNLPVIDETVPVYEGRLRLTRDLIIGQPVPEGEMTIEGAFRYQACDDKECYLPRTVPLKWTVRVERLDSQRAPAGLQRKVTPPAPALPR
jgi:DsbC/DsbD-like thiol-disulfide interchange protein